MSKKLEGIRYLDIFKKSFDIIWKNKSLWWFGLFLALGGGMNNFNFGFDEKNRKTGEEFSRFISNHIAATIAIAAICAVIFLALFILSLFAKGGLIISLENLLKNRSFGFRSEMKEGKKFFGSLFLLYLILFLLIMASLIVLATPVALLFTSKAYISAILLAILAAIIFIPLAILASFLKTFGEIYIVSGKLSAWSAIEASYDLLGKNLAASIVMALLFIPLNILVMLALIIVVAPIAILAVLFTFLGKFGVAITVILGTIIFLVILLIQSVFQTFSQTAWLLFFHEIAAPTEKEKVEEKIEETTSEKILPAPDTAIKTIESEK